MNDLLAYKAWKYFINLTGQEFPLKANLAIVRILKAFNGSNHMEGTPKDVLTKRIVRAPPLTLDITLAKGSAYIVATRPYVNFAINSDVGHQFIDWLRHTDLADETFFSSLNHSPKLGVPGSYTGHTSKVNFIGKYAVW
jgi:hypothetical protein